jgi:hypothetical protein
MTRPARIAPALGRTPPHSPGAPSKPPPGGAAASNEIKNLLNQGERRPLITLPGYNRFSL